MLDLESQIRKLARSNYYQEIYNASLNNFGIQLFNNTFNFSGIQYLFLYWVRIYHLLYKELAELEWENLDEEVIKDNIRCDAFLYWRSKQMEKQIKEYKKESKKMEPKKNRMKVWQGNKNKEGNK